MKTRWSRWAIALALALSVAPRGEAEELVIPPGQDKLLSQLLGGGQPLAGDCRLASARVEKTYVVAEYRCGEKVAKVELHHPEQKSGARKTSAFAVVPKDDVAPALLDALAASLRAGESAWRWTKAAANRGGDGKPAAPDLVGRPASPAGLQPADVKEYQRGLELYREGKHGDALAIYLALARREPKHGVLGMVVATLAPSIGDVAAAATRAKAANEAPTDLLLQFVAGVASHYAAHQAASGDEERRALYAQAIQFLGRVRPAYDFEPRVFIYLAISHFRLGNQLEAEKLIEKAIALSSDDPDAYYCRAEILHRKDPARAISDLRRYQDSVKKLATMGAVVSAKKSARVVEIIARLEAIRAGKESPTELFDTRRREGAAPKGSGGGQEGRGEGEVPASSGARSGFGQLVLFTGLAALAFAVIGALVVRRRKKGPPPEKPPTA